jgi:hypothetical protein
MENKAKYTETVKTKSRTYYLDLKVASNGNNYMQVAESRKNREGAYETVRLTVFQEDVPDFAAAIGRLIDQFSAQQKTDESKP